MAKKTGDDATKGKGDKPMSAEEAQVVVEHAVAEAMKGLGYEPGPDGKPDFSAAGDDPRAKVPEMVMNLFTSVLQQAAQPKGAPTAAKPAPSRGDVVAAASAPDTEEAAADLPEADDVVDLDAERQKRAPAPPSEFEQKVQDSIRIAFGTYMAEHVPDAGSVDEIDVDPEFLKEHGAGLFQAVLAGFARAIVPEELKVDVPVTSKDAETGESKEVKIKLDFGALFQGVANKLAEGTRKADDAGDES